MIFVVAEELIPEAKRGSPDIAAMSLMVGFSVMMVLDVALWLGFRQQASAVAGDARACRETVVYCRRGKRRRCRGERWPTENLMPET